MNPPSRFWDFSLGLYAKAGVPEACLALQARHGIDVNLLFCCLWLALEGRRLDRRDIARLSERVRDLHDGVIKPLRGARTLLKRLMPAEDETLQPALGALRNAIKASELEAEHLEQVMLGAFGPVGEQDAPSLALAKANAAAYLAFVDARVACADDADLAVILAALPKEPAVKLGLKATSPDRSLPLGKPGGGA